MTLDDHPDDHKLPCDVHIGSVKFCKGVSLGTLVSAAQRWFDAAKVKKTASSPSEGKEITLSPNDINSLTPKTPAEGITCAPSPQQPTQEAREIAESILWHGMSVDEATRLIDRFAAQRVATVVEQGVIPEWADELHRAALTAAKANARRGIAASLRDPHGEIYQRSLKLGVHATLLDIADWIAPPTAPGRRA